MDTDNEQTNLKKSIESLEKEITLLKNKGPDADKPLLLIEKIDLIERTLRELVETKQAIKPGGREQTEGKTNRIVDFLWGL